jgi:hypothetical protein
MVREAFLQVGRFLLSNILNMDQTPLPWEYLEGRTYEFKGKRTVWVRSKKSGWGKRQATIQLTIFADGVARVKPLIIFRGAETSNRTARSKEEKRYDPRVVVKFNAKAYANTRKFYNLLEQRKLLPLTHHSEIILFWLQEMLLPVLGSRPTLLVMDLLRSHKTGPVREVLKQHDIALSMVPGGCTGLVQPLDVSVNRPFKDILKQVIKTSSSIQLFQAIPLTWPATCSQEIEDELDRRETDPADVKGSSAVGEMRVLMTRCVGQAWSTFCEDRQEVVIKSFRQLGISLPIDGSADNELSVKGLSTDKLVAALSEWKTRGVPTGDGEDSEDSDSESEAGDADDDDDGPLELIELPPASESSITFPITDGDSPTSAPSSKVPQRGRGSGRRGRPRGSRAERGGRQPASTGPAELPETSPIIDDDSLGSAPSLTAPERGRGSGRRGRPRGSRAERGGRQPSSTGPSEVPETLPIIDDDSLGSAPSSTATEHGRGSGRRGRPCGSRAERGGRQPASTGPAELPETLPIIDDDSLGSAPSLTAPERGRGSGRRGRPRGSRAERGGRQLSSTGPSEVPETSAIIDEDSLGSASWAEALAPPERGRGHNRRGRPRGSRQVRGGRQPALKGSSKQPKSTSITAGDSPGSALALSQSLIVCLRVPTWFDNRAQAEDQEASSGKQPAT